MGRLVWIDDRLAWQGHQKKIFTRSFAGFVRRMACPVDERYVWDRAAGKVTALQALEIPIACNLGLRYAPAQAGTCRAVGPGAVERITASVECRLEPLKKIFFDAFFSK